MQNFEMENAGPEMIDVVWDVLEELDKEEQERAFISKKVMKEIQRRKNQQSGKNHVSEVHSEPRVTKCAKDCGLKPRLGTRPQDC